MKRGMYLLLPSLMLLFLYGCITPEGTVDPVASGNSTDILQAVLAMQDSMPPPPTQFRPGHVQPRTITAYLDKTKTGFVIQLPSASLTPSPTLYNGNLYVSGGFGSKEFYAFDAATGDIKWALDLDDDGPTSAIIADGVVVFNTESCTIFAVRADTGEMLWSHYLGDPLLSTPSIADGKVFTAYPASQGAADFQQFGGNQAQQQDNASAQAHQNADQLWGTHVLIALDLQSGAIVWQKWVDGDVMSAPVVEGTELYVTTFPGTLYKFDAHTGEILAAQASRATSAPVIVGDEVYVSRRADTDSATVQESIGSIGRDFFDMNRSHYSKAAPYLDQTVQDHSALKNQAMEYDAGNGFAAGAPANSGWQAASLHIGQSNVSSLQAFQGSRIVHLKGKNYATMGDELVATDTATGTVFWKHSLKGNLQQSGGFLATPPLIVGDKIVIAMLDGDVVVSEAESGEEVHRFSTGYPIRFQPIVDRGRIYVSTVDGKIIAIDTGDDALTGWPTWGANAAHTNRPE